MTNKQKAVFYMILSALAFAFMGASIKLTGDLPVAQKIFFRNLITVPLAFFVARHRKESLFGKKSSQKLLMARSVLGVISLFAYFYSIAHLQLADSAMLNKTFPFFLLIFAGLFLGEKIKKRQTFFVVLAFVGVLFVLKPRFQFDMLPALAGFGSAIFIGAAYALVSYLKKMEKPATLVFYFASFSLLASAPFMFFQYQKPLGITWVYLFLTGIFGSIAQFALTQSYRLGKASDVGIYNYLTIIFSSIIAYFIWQEIPDMYSALGTLIVLLAAAGLFVSQTK